MTVLSTTRDICTPPLGARDAAWSRIAVHIALPSALRAARAVVHPGRPLEQRLWQRICTRIAHPLVHDVFAHLRDTLYPVPAMLASFHTFAERLSRVPLQTLTIGKWAVAFAIVLVALRASPLLFLAPQTTAESSVLLLPTRGEVFLSQDGQWKVLTADSVLPQGAHVRTGDGEVTIVLHDDGVVRLAPETEIVLTDLADRPTAIPHSPTLVLVRGRVWVQGLLTGVLSPLVIATHSGLIELHEGSAGIYQNDLTEFTVWDRHADVIRDSQRMMLVSGDRVQLWSGNIPVVRRVPHREYLGAWVSQNFDRDAVHRREIAGREQKRRRALAGILPTSPLYPVKRAAEAVDVFLTLGEEERARKQLTHAETRLNEAAALLTEDRDSASQSLAEYKEALLEVASGSGGNSLVQALIRERVTESAAALSAVLPDAEEYLLKQVVLETRASLPQSIVEFPGAEEVFLLDSLVLLRDLATEDPIRAQTALGGIRSMLTFLRTGEHVISLPIRKEALSLLSQVVAMLQADADRSPEEQALLTELLAYAPVATVRVAVSLSDAEVEQVVAEIHRNVFATYKMPRSRLNQLFAELHRFRGHPDEGRILRRVYREFPEGSELTRFVRSAIQSLRVQRIGEQGIVGL